MDSGANTGFFLVSTKAYWKVRASRFLPIIRGKHLARHQLISEILNFLRPNNHGTSYRYLHGMSIPR